MTSGGSIVDAFKDVSGRVVEKGTDSPLSQAPAGATDRDDSLIVFCVEAPWSARLVRREAGGSTHPSRLASSPPCQYQRPCWREARAGEARRRRRSEADSPTPAIRSSHAVFDKCRPCTCRPRHYDWSMASPPALPPPEPAGVPLPPTTGWTAALIEGGSAAACVAAAAASSRFLSSSRATWVC